MKEKKKIKDSPTWIDRSLVVSPCYVGLCQSKKSYKKAIKHLNVKNPPDFILNDHSDASVHFFEKKGILTALVCIGKTKNHTPNEIVGLLIHESVHIWQEIKLNIGEHSPSREFEAYSIQSIAQKLIEAYETD